MTPALEWTSGPPEPRLAPGDVHVWCAALDPAPDTVARLAAWLSPDERRRADRYHFARDRRRFTVGRATLRGVLSRYVGAAPARLEFRYGTHGKPALAGALAESDLRFNCAHSGELVLAALTRAVDVGVDLELIHDLEGLEAIAERTFSAAENAALRSLPAEQTVRSFFSCWTRKEAYVKAIGTGLSCPLDRFDVSLAPGAPARLLAIEGDPCLAASWTMADLAPGPGYVGALAVPRPVAAVQHWRWTHEPLAEPEAPAW